MKTDPLEYKKAARKTLTSGLKNGGLAAQIAYAYRAPVAPQVLATKEMGSFQHAVWRVHLGWPDNAPKGVPHRVFLKAFIGNFCVWTGSGADLCAREWAMQAVAAQAGIPMPQRHKFTYEGMDIILTPEVVGTLATDLPGNDHLAVVGGALAKLHQVEGAKIDLPQMGLAPLCASMRKLGRKAKRNDLVELAELAAEVLADEAAPQPVVTHGDPHLKNWIMTGAGKIGTLLDFEDAAFSEPARDVVIALRFAEIEKKDPRVFLKAYQKTGGASFQKLAQWRALLDLQDVALAVRLEQEVLFGARLPQTDVKRWLSYLRVPAHNIEDELKKG